MIYGVQIISVNSHFSQESYDGNFCSYYLRIKSVIMLCSDFILLFLSATLWQKLKLHIHLYSHFMQNSVMNVNWHINKKKKTKFDMNNCQEANKNRFSVAYRNAVAQGSLVLLRHP